MAEINIQNTNSSRRKTAPPRVDLTPMVDLGFLLITFFMFTTVLSEPKVMDINMPFKPSNDKMAFIDTSTITIIPTNNNRFLYYSGVLESKEDLQIATALNIRDVIINKQQALKKLPSSFSIEAHQLHIIIKPKEDSRYEDLVRVLDEMQICSVPYYVIDDLTEEEVISINNRLSNKPGQSN